MKLILLLLFAFCLVADTGNAAPPSDLARFFAGHDGAFVLYDVQKKTYERYRPEQCRRRFRPQSTRKIVEGLIGLETGVIPDADHRYRWDGTRHFFDAHNRDHSLRTALAASTNWYFERVDAKVGKPELARRFKQLGFGNATLGDRPVPYGEDALEISAEEQVEFLLRLYQRRLPLSRRSMDVMRDVMHYKTTEKGTLRGKTGTGGHTRDGKPRRPNSEMVATLGWYVGWVEHGDNAWIFATNITGGDNPTGVKARRITEAILSAKGLF